MEKKKKLKKIDYRYILNSSEVFLNESKSNPFYKKKVFFSEELRDKFCEFQIVGNLGGLGDNISFDNKTDYYIVSDKFMNLLKIGNQPNQIIELEKKINTSHKKLKNLKIISENSFLLQCKKRCDEINDLSSASLLNRVI